MCKIYIKAFIWYFQIADPYPLEIVKTHFLISQNATELFTQVYETLLFNIYLKSRVINKRYGQKWDIKMWGCTDT